MLPGGSGRRAARSHDGAAHEQAAHKTSAISSRQTSLHSSIRASVADRSARLSPAQSPGCNAADRRVAGLGAGATKSWAVGGARLAHARIRGNVAAASHPGGPSITGAFASPTSAIANLERLAAWRAEIVPRGTSWNRSPAEPRPGLSGNDRPRSNRYRRPGRPNAPNSVGSSCRVVTTNCSGCARTSPMNAVNRSTSSSAAGSSSSSIGRSSVSSLNSLIWEISSTAASSFCWPRDIRSRARTPSSLILSSARWGPTWVDPSS